MTVKTLTPVAASAVLIGLISSSLLGQDTPPAFPGRLGDAIARYLKPTAAEKAKLLQGEPVTKFLDADPSVEVAIFGAVWVKAPVARYVAAVKDIEQFEKGGTSW